LINYHKKLVGTLKNILPVHYEMALHRNLSVPCISYMELGNSATHTGDTVGYSAIQYQIKVWANKLEDLQTNAAKIDDALRPLGWRRISAQELYDTSSTMIQKILVYEANALETFK
jgi:hypothetical protein